MVGNWNDFPPRPGKVQPTPHLECSDIGKPTIPRFKRAVITVEPDKSI
jgi:hypothetical protein